MDNNNFYRYRLNKNFGIVLKNTTKAQVIRINIIYITKFYLFLKDIYNKCNTIT